MEMITFEWEGQVTSWVVRQSLLPQLRRQGWDGEEADTSTGASSGGALTPVPPI